MKNLKDLSHKKLDFTLEQLLKEKARRLKLKQLKARKYQAISIEDKLLSDSIARFHREALEMAKWPRDNFEIRKWAIGK